MNLLQAPDSSEQAVAPAGAEQTGNDGAAKDKKAAAEPHRQKAKEAAPRAEPAALEANAVPDGDRPHKRPEKRRQSLGGFFKGLVGGSFASPSWALGPECGARVRREPAGSGLGRAPCARRCARHREHGGRQLCCPEPTIRLQMDEGGKGWEAWEGSPSGRTGLALGSRGASGHASP